MPTLKPCGFSLQGHEVLELVTAGQSSRQPHGPTSKSRCTQEPCDVGDHLDSLSPGILGQRLQGPPLPHTWKPSEASLVPADL